MTVDDKIRDKKLQYAITREAPKISDLYPGKTDKYKYVTGEEIFPSDQRTVIKQGKNQSQKQLKQLKIMKNSWLSLMKKRF